MISISMLNHVTQLKIIVNGRLQLNRFYLVDNDIPTFNNRLVFKATPAQLEQVWDVLANLTEPDLLAEVDRLKALPTLSIVIPIALRVREEAHTNFVERKAEFLSNVINLELLAPDIFLRGVHCNAICVACARQAELKGKLCPDYVAGVYTCFKSSRIQLDALDTFYLDEKGDLIYNAASITDIDEPTVESDASKGASTTD